MPDPFLLILAVIAVVCVVLYPLRIWRKNHHRYGPEADGGDGDVPLAPPKRGDSD